MLIRLALILLLAALPILTWPAPTAPPLRPSFVVVIDPGHGGKDSGALGATGTAEKSVALAIALKLRDFIRQEPSLKGVLTRSDDRFLDLKQRADFARRADAQLFISLHADAFEQAEVKGSSVYVLSEHGASSEVARLLADRENAGEIGGVDLGSEDALVASVLADLSKNATREASERAAHAIMESLAKDFKLHHQSVQKAGFRVLKSLDVPSMLIELGFISSREEENRLKDPKIQDRLARAIARGILRYASLANRGSVRPNATPAPVKQQPLLPAHSPKPPVAH